MDGPSRDDFVRSTGQLYRPLAQPLTSSAFSLRLAQVSPLKSCGAQFESLSLLFTAERSAGLLAQGTYEWENDCVGVQPIFIAPVTVADGEAGQQYYEAVFTRRRLAN